jgi:hypothetical protein
MFADTGNLAIRSQSLEAASELGNGSAVGFTAPGEDRRPELIETAAAVPLRQGAGR